MNKRSPPIGKGRMEAGKIAEATRELLVLAPDLRTVLDDLNASGLGRARCFLQALDKLEAAVKEPKP